MSIVIKALLLALISLTLLGCGGNNFSGRGQEFVVRGKVTKHGKHSLTAKVYELVEVSGPAYRWFDDFSTHQFHDNCNCRGTFRRNKQYGHVWDSRKNVVRPSLIPIGTCIEFTGKLRSHSSGKTSPTRPVYDIAQEIDCPNVSRDNLS